MAPDYTYTTTTVDTGLLTGYLIFMGIFAVIAIAGMWKTFTKAGEPGWAAIIPIYNTIVLLKIAGKPVWWIFLFLIPIVNIVMLVLTLSALSTSFGKGGGFTALLFFLAPIGFCVLGFGSAQYQGPGGVQRRQYADYPQQQGQYANQGHQQGGYPQ